ncbi:MAG: sigma-54 dependent transcriptional regulator [Candidatus Omnitrophica bacterium]|nr:sigma-54 dependent transcriptional regulator [Candidatus Omnitrophota bacterium]
MPDKILLVDDETDLLEWLSVVLEKEGYSVCCASSGQEALEWFKKEAFNMVISDIRMSPMDGIELLKKIKIINPEVIVLMITAYASVDTAVSAFRYGAYDYLLKPFKLDEIKLVIKKAAIQKRIFSADKSSQKKLKQRYGFSNIIGQSRVMQNVFDRVEKVAKSNSTVLIYGESGTGKELIAKALHYHSLRARCPFVSIDCGALPQELLESELFGHIKGSFTGAISSKLGLFEVAHGGTLFLDEIGETSPALQMKLLRVLQEKEIRPVGATKPILVDVRIAAATNRDLEEEIKKNNFREDLFYRLSVISLYLPRLEQRLEDIPLLVSFFLKKYNLPGTDLKKIGKKTLELLTGYSWPGNVRELENCIESAVTLAEKTTIEPEDLPERIRNFRTQQGKEAKPASLRGKIESFEKEIIYDTLQKLNGDKEKTAKILKMTRRNLDYKIKKYQIKTSR